MHYFADTQSSELKLKTHIFDFELCFDIQKTVYNSY
jgi:hypothetical protein